MKQQHKCEVHEYETAVGIKATPEFEKKGLANYKVDVGLKCGHGCKYCSAPSNLRRHKAFTAIGRTAFEEGFAISDPGIVERLDSRELKKSDTVMLCTLSDGWSPEAHELRLGSKSLKHVLETSEANVRILTKNVNVRDDFDFIEKYKNRVHFGMSITGLPRHESAIKKIEPYASPVTERIALMQEAHGRGIRTYGMFCPLLPGLFSSRDEVEELLSLALEFGTEHVWSEPVNNRGRAFKQTQAALASDFPSYARAVKSIRTKKLWCGYGQWVTQSAQQACRNLGVIDKLNILLYQSSFDQQTINIINRDTAGVIWL